jgi:hypothetical protein
MGLDLTGYTGVLALLWNDRMDITTTEEDASGIGDNAVYPEVPQQTDVPCRISFSSKDTAKSNNELREPISLNPTIFCAPDVNIIAGDKITVRRCHADGTVYETFKGCAVISGKPNKWDNHQEVELDISGDA